MAKVDAELVIEQGDTTSLETGSEYSSVEAENASWLEAEYVKSFITKENAESTHKNGWFFSSGVLLVGVTYASVHPGWTTLSIIMVLLMVFGLGLFQIGTRLKATQKYYQESAVLTCTMFMMSSAIWLVHNCNASNRDTSNSFEATMWRIDVNNASVNDVVELLDWAKTWYQTETILMIFICALFFYTFIGLGLFQIQHRIARPGLILLLLIPLLSFIVIAATHQRGYKNTKLLNVSIPLLFVYLFICSMMLYASEQSAAKRKRLWRHEHVLDLRVNALQAEHDAHVKRHEQLVVKTEGLETEAAMRDLLKDNGEHGLFALYVKAMSGSETASRVLKAFLVRHRAQSNASTISRLGKRVDSISMMEMSVAATAVEVGTAWMERLRAASKGGGFRKQESQQSDGLPVTEVFLGGSCNPTTWRKEIAIPMFEEHDIRYYNPQVEEWTEELTAIEGKAKEAATVQLFIIDGQTRAMAAILEATEYLCRGRVVVLAVLDIPPGSSILGEAVGVEELKDLNRARTYLRESAARHGVPTYADVNDACDAVVKLFDAHHEVVVHGLEEGSGTDTTYVDSEKEGEDTDTFDVDDTGSPIQTPSTSLKGKPKPKPKPRPKSRSKSKPKKNFRKMSREEAVITRFKVESMKLHTRESWARAKALTKSLSKITSGQFESGHTMDLSREESPPKQPPRARSRAMQQPATPTSLQVAVSAAAETDTETEAETPTAAPLSQLALPPE